MTFERYVILFSFYIHINVLLNKDSITNLNNNKQIIEYIYVNLVFVLKMIRMNE